MVLKNFTNSLQLRWCVCKNITMLTVQFIIGTLSGSNEKKTTEILSYWVDVFHFRRNIYVVSVSKINKKNSWKFIAQNKSPSFARFGRFIWEKKAAANAKSQQQHVLQIPANIFSLLFLFIALRCVFGVASLWRVTFSFNLFPTVKNYLTWNVVALAGNESIVRSYALKLHDSKLHLQRTHRYTYYIERFSEKVIRNLYWKLKLERNLNGFFV